MLWTALMLAQAAAIAPLPEFLSGCWEERRPDGGWTEECWTAPRGGLMLGSGRDGKADQVRHWEWMRVERGSDGSISFYASPKGAPAIAFEAREAGANAVTFVNPANDFPQRVRYRRTATGLEAEISLLDGSKPVRWSYRSSRSRPKD
jgi:ABC-type sugar transport system substrate-binding protein